MLLENAAALTGLVVALASVACSHLFGWPLADGTGSIIIGVILGFVAAIMCIETRRLLIGEHASPKMIAAMRKAIMDELGPSSPVERLHDVSALHLGPGDIRVTARLDFADGVTAKTAEATIARLDGRLRARFPQVRHLYLEAPAATVGAATLATGAAPEREPHTPLAMVCPKNHAPQKTGRRKSRR